MIIKTLCVSPLLPAWRLAGLVLLALLVSACDRPAPPPPLAWDGQWQRTLHVPTGSQGRCVDEVLTINKKQWHLRAIVHSTYECNQPFLEILYDGVLQQVAIKRGTQDRVMTFSIDNIHLAELVDVAGTDRAVLKGEALKSLSGQYVPSGYQFFEQSVQLGDDKQSMQSNVFKPVLTLLSPDENGKISPVAYRRITPEQPAS